MKKQNHPEGEKSAQKLDLPRFNPSWAFLLGEQPWASNLLSLTSISLSLTYDKNCPFCIKFNEIRYRQCSACLKYLLYCLVHYKHLIHIIKYLSMNSIMFSRCIVQFSSCWDITPDTHKLNERFILAHGLEVSVHVFLAPRQKHHGRGQGGGKLHTSWCLKSENRWRAREWGPGTRKSPPGHAPWPTQTRLQCALQIS